MNVQLDKDIQQPVDNVDNADSGLPCVLAMHPADSVVTTVDCDCSDDETVATISLAAYQSDESDTEVDSFNDSVVKLDNVRVKNDSIKTERAKTLPLKETLRSRDENTDETFARLFVTEQRTFHPNRSVRASGDSPVSQGLTTSNTKNKRTSSVRNGAENVRGGAQTPPPIAASVSQTVSLPLPHGLLNRDADGESSKLLFALLERTNQERNARIVSPKTKQQKKTRKSAQKLAPSIELSPALRGIDGLADLSEMANALSTFDEKFADSVAHQSDKFDRQLESLIENWHNLSRKVRDAITELARLAR
ncbi:MAG: hypothetical protein LBU65_00370 [Planctomycetaceae bacterium]|jgi:hypothetical protein|nr:hypothetical protein [Planctomycetaceae bacterium]